MNADRLAGSGSSRSDELAGRGFSPGDERGSALVLALAATALVLALASALTLIAVCESAVSASFVRGSQTAYLAEAAVARATAELDAIADWSAVLNGLASSSLKDGAAEGVHEAGGVVVDLTAQTAALNRNAASRPFGSNNPQWRLFVWGPAEWLAGPGVVGYLAVWVADDPDEQDDDPLADGGEEPGRGVLLLTAHAFGPGGVRRMVEVTVSRKLAHSTRALVWRPVR
jgi:hypothetical protein